MYKIIKGQLLSNRFTLIEKLGQSSLGQVWLARYNELEQFVAIKILNPQIFSKKDRISIIQSEFHRVSQLRHPNILRVFDFHHDQDLNFISMEYVEGESLDTFIEDRDRISYTEAISLLLPVVDALVYAHSLEIVHGRIKTSNILIQQDNIPKLTDFGFAGISYHHDDIIYEAGLQHFGQGNTTFSDDIRSLGILIYELLTGQNPFNESLPPEKRFQMATPSINKQLRHKGATIPPSLESLIQRMLSDSVDQRLRLAGMEEVRSLLEQVLETEFNRPRIYSFEINSPQEEPELERQVIRPVQLSGFNKRSFWSGFGGKNIFKTLVLLITFVALVGGGLWFLRHLSQKPDLIATRPEKKPDENQKIEAEKKEANQPKKQAASPKTEGKPKPEPAEAKNKPESQPSPSPQKMLSPRPKPREEVKIASKPEPKRQERIEPRIQPKPKKPEPSPEELAFKRYKTEGLRAFQNKDYVAAKTAFERALTLQPYSTEIKQTLDMVNDAINQEKAKEKLQVAQAAETKEEWDKAVKAYQDALQVMPSLQDALDGKKRAEKHQKYMKFIQFYLNKPEALHSDKTLEKVKRFLQQAPSISPKGPKLASQIEKLAQLVQEVQIPVIVTLQSDNNTEVEIFKVGKLGKFNTKELTLRPGNYTVLGWRSGYKDVRQKIRVKPGKPLTATIICTEEI